MRSRSLNVVRGGEIWRQVREPTVRRGGCAKPGEEFRDARQISRRLSFNTRGHDTAPSETGLRRVTTLI